MGFGKAGSLDAAAESSGSRRGTDRGRRVRRCRGRAKVVAASGAAPLLPDGGNAPGITAADDGVERANVDPELQRARRDDAEEVPAEEAALYLAPLSGRTLPGTARCGAPGQRRPGRRRSGR